MKIKDLYTPGKTVFSLEVFPPNKNFPIETVYDAIEGLAAINPAYISVTYGAGGNRANRSTCEIASHIKKKYGIEAMAHLTCINSTRDDVDFMLDDFAANGIENILALRGDNKPDEEPKNDFPHASDLTAYIASKGNFDIAGACYPETHVDAESAEEDIKNLKIKVDAGASHLVSQLFFDNSCYYDFEKRARAAGIDVPIAAGIMPVTNKKQKYGTKKQITSRYCCLDEMVTVLLLYLLHVIVIGTRHTPSPSTYSIFSISATAVKSVLDNFSRILRFADAVNVTVFFPPSVSEYFPFEVR